MQTERYDVVVAGGGPAGLAAAVAAARQGSSVLLIEQQGALGGSAVNSLVPVFCPYSDGEKAIIRGIGLEILNKMTRECWKNPYPVSDNGIPELDWVAIDPEVLKRVADEMILQSGVRVWLHTVVTGIEYKDGRIEALSAFCRGTTYKVQADVFIDCTGDANLVFMAGGGFEYGDEEACVQGMTLCFRLSGMDGYKFLDYKKNQGENENLQKAVSKARKEGNFPFAESRVSTFALQNPHMAGVNFGHIYEKNPLKREELTQAEMEARRQLPELIAFIRSYVPGAENCVLASSGAVIGVRESRRIIGEYRMTRADYEMRREFEDKIARYAYPVDVHASSPDKVVKDESKDEFITTKYKDGESYTIPYRALLPVGFENLLVAGRSISSSRDMNGSLRVMPACFAVGQAAGTAAVIASQKKERVNQICVADLQSRLIEQGAYL